MIRYMVAHYTFHSTFVYLKKIMIQKLKKDKQKTIKQQELAQVWAQGVSKFN